MGNQAIVDVLSIVHFPWRLLAKPTHRPLRLSVPISLSSLSRKLGREARRPSHGRLLQLPACRPASPHSLPRIRPTYREGASRMFPFAQLPRGKASPEGEARSI